MLSGSSDIRPVTLLSVSCNLMQLNEVMNLRRAHLLNSVLVDLDFEYDAFYLINLINDLLVAEADRRIDVNEVGWLARIW